MPVFPQNCYDRRVFARLGQALKSPCCFLSAARTLPLGYLTFYKRRLRSVKQPKIRQQGYKALIDSLDVANNLRFLQQIGAGYGDYTKDRHQWLDQLSIEDFRSYIRDQQSEAE